MEPTNNSKYIATPVKVLMTILIVLTVVIMLQTIIVEMAMTFARTSRQPLTEQAKEPTEEEKRLSRIQYSLKQCLPDGTIHLVHQPGRKYYYQWEESSTQQIYDVNEHLVWEGIAKDCPYKYISQPMNIYGNWFQAREMRSMHHASPDVCRTLDIPVRSGNSTVEIWRYIPWRQSFIGYKTGGGIIGYAGASGFANSASQAGAFGKFGSFIAWCPKDSTTPKLLWQTSRRIYEINFEESKVELVFESPDVDIESLRVNKWGSLKPRGVESVEGYRPLLHCHTIDAKDYLIMRDPGQTVAVKTPEDWSRWRGEYGQFSATEQGIFLYRHWVDMDALPAMPENFASLSLQAQDDWLRDQEARPKKHWADVYKVDDGGNIALLNRYGWTVPGRTGRTPRWMYTWLRTRRCVSQFSPALYDLIWHIPGVRMSRSDYRGHRNEIYREVLIFIEQFRSGAGFWSFVLGALMVGFTGWHGWPRRRSRAVFIFWLVFVGLFNLAGLLTYLALNHTPVIKCPICGNRRGLGQPQCVRCRRDLPAPKPGKLDLIFDTQIAPAT